MTNEQLEKLTADAANLAQSFEPLLLDGDGNFLTRRDMEVRAPSEVLRLLAQCERQANALYRALANEPRRRSPVPVKGDSNE